MTKHDSSPTMIIPAGTEIQIDVHGQLSVRTPGNLVIQNSGHYGEIESVHGSIRIEADAEVEAVSVRCAETCFVQGSLTSWKVKAKAIHLEEKAQARIVLQETETIDIGKNAHLVGNFSSEKELFLLFSRFAQQLRSLPFYFDRKDVPVFEAPDGAAERVAADQAIPERVSDEAPSAPAARPEGSGPAPTRSEPLAAARGAEPSKTGTGPAAGLGGSEASRSVAARVEVPSVSSRALEASKELPDQLFFALVLLEREAKSEAYGTTSVRVLEELVKLLKERDLEALQHTFRSLFGRVVEPGEDVRRANELIGQFFQASAGAKAAQA